MYVDDGYRWHKHEIIELYLQGKTPGAIAGLTGVPRIRIKREMDRMTRHNTKLLTMHLESRQYPSRRCRDIDPRMTLCQG